MDDMYTTVQTACRMANRAHRKEQRQHIVFREMGLWRVKPSEEIREITEDAIYGWTVPRWSFPSYGDVKEDTARYHEVKALYPKGNAPFVRPLFGDGCYWGVSQIETTVTPRLSRDEVTARVTASYEKKHGRPSQTLFIAK